MRHSYGSVIMLEAMGLQNYASFTNYEQLFKCFSDLKQAATRLYCKGNNAFKIDFTSFSNTTCFIISDESNYNHSNKNINSICPACRLAKKIIDHGFKNNVFFRGVISCGQIIKNGSFFAGPAIDKAKKYYQKLNHIGISLTPQAKFLAKTYANKCNCDWFEKSQQLLLNDQDVDSNFDLKINWATGRKQEIMSKMHKFYENVQLNNNLAGFYEKTLEFANLSIKKGNL